MSDMSQVNQEQIREAVGVFEDKRQLDEAIAELESTKFPRHDISTLGSRDEIEEKYGSGAVDPSWLEDNPDAPRGISIRPEEKVIGASVIVGGLAYFGGCAAAIAINPASTVALLSSIGIGSLCGAVAGAGIVYLIGRRFQKRTERQIGKGGLLLWVRTPGSRREELAKDILRRNGAKDVHIHSIT